MAHKNKIKGTYHEKAVADWLNSIGLETKRVPLSGSLGGEYTGDLWISLVGRKLVAEVKHRDKSGFPNPFRVLNERDLAIYKRRTGDPKTLVILPMVLFEQIIKETQK